MTYFVVRNNELYHYGVKGMKWGKHKAFDPNKLSDQERRRYEVVNARIDAKNRKNNRYEAQRKYNQDLQKDLMGQYGKMYKKSTSIFTKKSDKEKYNQGMTTTREAMDVVQTRLSDIDQKQIANKRNAAALMQEKSRIEVAQLNSTKGKSLIQKGAEWLSGLFKKKEKPKGGIKRPIPSGGKAR